MSNLGRYCSLVKLWTDVVNKSLQPVKALKFRNSKFYVADYRRSSSRVAKELLSENPLERIVWGNPFDEEKRTEAIWGSNVAWGWAKRMWVANWRRDFTKESKDHSLYSNLLLDAERTPKIAELWARCIVITNSHLPGQKWEQFIQNFSAYSSYMGFSYIQSMTIWSFLFFRVPFAALVTQAAILSFPPAGSSCFGSPPDMQFTLNLEYTWIASIG